MFIPIDEVYTTEPAAANAVYEIEHGERQRLAISLTQAEGVSPSTLNSNSLDEEPMDGFLCGQPAHYAWRERLWRI